MSAHTHREKEFRVFVCEDMDDPDEYQREFDRHRGDRPRLVVCDHWATFDDCRDHLLDADPFPDLVLVDDRLRRGSEAAPMPSAIDLMSTISNWAYLNGIRPRCVLWSAATDPLFLYTFRACGGWHVVSKSEQYWPDRVQVLYDVLLAGRQWWPPRPELELTPSERGVLPYFDAGLSRAEIAECLNTTQATIESRKDELRDAVIRHAGRSLPPGEMILARYARDAGWLWVPYADHGRLPRSPALPHVLDPAMIP
jgi:hypothetical protein